MRTIVELPEQQLKALADVCEREGISRAEAVRRAVQAFVDGQRPGDAPAAFGCWRRRRIRGLAYERRLRAEW